MFGPAWTTLFVMMAIAAWMVWKPEGLMAAARPLTLFAVQLGLNIAWSSIFFGAHQPGWAFAEIVILWLVISRVHSYVADGRLGPNTTQALIVSAGVHVVRCNELDSKFAVDDDLGKLRY